MSELNATLVELERLLGEDADEGSPPPATAVDATDEVLKRWRTYTLEELTRLGPLDDVTERELFLLDKITTFVDEIKDTLELA